MKEHFQLFSGPMVRAILEGRKDMTRRLVTPENSLIDGKSARTREGKALWARLNWKSAAPLIPPPVAVREHVLGGREFVPYFEVCEKLIGPNGGWPVHIVSPYVRMGDVLIGKETFVLESSGGEYELKEPKDRPFHRDDEGRLCVPHYRATEPEPHIVPWDRIDGSDDRTIWRPSIFMPRWASRLRLEMVDTFPQRLQEISKEDCLREGIRWVEMDGYASDQEGRHFHAADPRRSYEYLWTSLNGEGVDGWEANAPVWVRVFKRL